MAIQGMELFAIGVVIILFMAVLKQFGILEPMSSFEGKGPPGAPLLADRYRRFRASFNYGMTLPVWSLTASVGNTLI